MSDVDPRTQAAYAKIRAAADHSECHEEITRRGELQPCKGTAVALRVDPNYEEPYPVCSRHARFPMVTLPHLVAALSGVPAHPKENP